MKISLVGPSFKQRSEIFDAQQTINLFPVLDQQGLEVSALYGTPGLSIFCAVGFGPVRASFAATNGRSFVVSGNSVYEIFVDGTSALRGNLSASFVGNQVSVDENGFQLAICDGNNLYILTYSTNSFGQVTDPDLPACGSVTFIDGYFVVNKLNSGSFYISSLYDGTAWNSLDFATAESSPDNLLRVLNAAGGTLWLLGSNTTEIWNDTGATDFPFAKISGGKMEVGILAPFTAIAVDNSLFWVGQDRNGMGIVYRAQGLTPQRISTNPIELIVQNCPSPSTLFSYTYQQDGHVFYVITGGGMSSTLVYDISTQLWHERAYLNSQGFNEAHLAYCGMFSFGETIVGSRIDGTIYKMAMDIYSDGGNSIQRKRVFTHLSNENKRIRYNDLQLQFENGGALQIGQGSDPQVMMRLSKDGARTWSTQYTAALGKVGEYMRDCTFRRIGIAQILTFEISFSDPIKVAWIGAYLNA